MKRLLPFLVMMFIFQNGFGQRIGLGIALSGQNNPAVFNGYHIEEGALSSYGFNALNSFKSGTLAPYIFIDFQNRLSLLLKVNAASNNAYLTGNGPSYLFGSGPSTSGQGLSNFLFIDTRIRSWKTSLDANYTLFNLKKFKINAQLGFGFTKTASDFSKDPLNRYDLFYPIDYGSGSAATALDLENANISFFENNYFPLFGYFHWQSGVNLKYQNISLGFEYGSSFTILNDVNNTFKRFFWSELRLGVDLFSKPANFKRTNSTEFSNGSIHKKNSFSIDVGSMLYFNADFKHAQTFESQISYLDTLIVYPNLESSFLSVTNKSSFSVNLPSVGISFNHYFNSNLWCSTSIKWQSFRYSYKNARIELLDSTYSEPRLRIFDEGHNGHLTSLDYSLNYNFISHKKWRLYTGVRLSGLAILNKNSDFQASIKPLKYDLFNFSYGLNLGVEYQRFVLNFNYSRTVMDAIRSPNFSALGKINNFNFSFSIPL